MTEEKNVSPILIAVDEPDLRNRLTQCLKPNLYKTVLSDNSLETLRQNQDEYIAILLDSPADNPASPDLLTKIRTTYPQIPIIFFPGKNYEAGIAALKKGIFGFLPESFSDTDLAVMIKSLESQDLSLWRVSSNVCEFLQIPLCIVWLLDENRKSFVVKAWNGLLDDNFRMNIKINKDELATQNYFKKGIPLYISDVTDSNKAKAYKHHGEAEKRKWRSLLTSPMISKGQVIGILDAYSINETFEFTEQHKRLLHTFAFNAANSFNTRQIYSQSKILSEINRQLSSALDLKKILPDILKNILKMIGTDQGFVYVLDRKFQTLKLRSSFGIDKKNIHNTIHLKENSVNIIADTQQDKKITDNIEQYYLKSGRLQDYSETIQPIIYRDVLIGLFGVLTHHSLDINDKKILNSFSSHIGSALDREKQAIHMKKIRELSRELNIDPLLDYIVESVNDLTGLIVVLWELDEKKSGFKIRAHRGLSEEYVKRAFTPIKGTKTGKALKDKDIIWCSNIYEDTQEPKFHNIEEAKKYGWTFFICVPLLTREGISLGSLSLYGKNEKELSERQRIQLWTFANHISMALENHKKRTSLEQLNTVGEIAANEINQGLSHVLNKISESAGKIFNSDIVTIYPFKPNSTELFDTDNIGVCGIKQNYKPVKPGKAGLTSIIMDSNELIVHNIDEYEMEEIDFRKISYKGQDDLIYYINKLKFIQSEKIKSFAGISIKTVNSDTYGGEQQLGVMYINFLHPHKISREEIDMIHLFAQQVSRAILTTRYAETLELFQEISSSISTSLDVTETLHMIVKGALGLTNADAGVIHHIDTEEKIIKESYKHPEDFVEHKSRFQQNTGLTWEIFNNRKIIYIPDVAKDERVAQGVKDRNVKSMIAIPLLLNNEVIGVLFLNSFSTHDFKKDEKILKMLGEQAALFINKAKKYENRIRDIDAFKEITHAILKKDINEFQLIAEKSMIITGAAYCTLRLLDESEKNLILKASAGRIAKKNLLPVDDESIAGQVAKTGAGIQCPDVEDNCPYYWKWHDDVKSCMCVPLKLNEKVIGTLYVESTKKLAFSEHRQLDLLQALANKASIVIHIRKIYEQREKEMKALEDINNAVVSSRLDNILKLIAEKIVETMPGEYCSLWLLEEKTDDLTMEAMYGIPEEKTIGKKRIKKENSDSINMKVVKTGEPYICQDAVEEHFHKIYPEARSSLTVPLIYKNNTIGTLNIESENKNAFQKEHESLLSRFSNLAAISIENAKLYNNQITAIKEISNSISAPFDLNCIFDRLIEWAILLMKKASLGEIRLIDKEKNELCVFCSKGEIKKEFNRMPLGQGITGYAAQVKETILVNNVFKNPHYLKFRDETKSELAVPIMGEGEIIGVINIEHPELDAFDDSNVKMAEAIATLAFIAFNNNRQYKQLKEHANELEKLKELMAAVELAEEISNISLSKLA
ncbi:GAF domain-containing protein [Desulfonema limicola]|uniref:GAF domain-containing protein n=1 Tax=Desulfonema limicola TaxID=45656 RepID=A0A975BD40_9BACT|nr:GAF domain-containing protein [Desulfonema limicola]QTA83302.1 GAF domain-containing protein [Desulfonema limicola]